MQDAFAIVLFVVVALAAVAALWALVTSRGSYDQIGRGGLSIDERRPSPGGGSATEREAEIRQMLEARNARRAARGEAVRDVDVELRELTDPALREEIRSLVEAANARRARRGEPALDVEAEIDRRLREL